MATETIRDYLSLQAEVLSLREKRNLILGSNIANAATPHYKARDINFQDALEKRLRTPLDAGMRQPRHLPLTGGLDAEVGYRQPLQPSMDGNTVELGVEQMQFSENVVRYQATLSMLNKRISGLMTAIRGE
jgi:flagellar basal-body rod protein FlgB